MEDQNRIPEKLPEASGVPGKSEAPENFETGKTADPEIARLRAKISEMEKQHAAEINSLRCENAIALELYRSGAKNLRAVRALIALPEPLELGSDGKAAGLDEAIAALKKSDAYLFEDTKKPKLSGALPAESSGELPDFSRMTYSQISDFLAKNPQYAISD